MVVKSRKMKAVIKKGRRDWRSRLTLWLIIWMDLKSVEVKIEPHQIQVERTCSESTQKSQGTVEISWDSRKVENWNYKSMLPYGRNETLSDKEC